MTKWLKELFETEYCAECGGDWYDHSHIKLNLGAYGMSNFALCKIANNPQHTVRSRES